MTAFAAAYNDAGPGVSQPIPIKPAMAVSGEYPIDAMSPKLLAAARAIIDKVQVPPAIAANSVLAAASLGVQPYIDVELPTGEVIPTSLFVVTVASSGDRKSSCDKLALRAVRQREREMRDTYRDGEAGFKADLLAYQTARKKATTGKKTRDQIKEEIEACGPEPVAPAQPILLSDEGTLQGLQKLFAEAMPSLGLFSDEGGQWLGGHSMSEENRGATGAALSKLWDGAPIKRIRGGDGVSFLPGRRLALHLMVQPRIARRLFGDPDLKDQGLLSRILISQPSSIKGDRPWREPDAVSNADLERYDNRLWRLLSDPLPMDIDTRELRPKTLRLSDEAKALFVGWHDAVERDLRPGGAYEDVAGFAAKLPEHSVRLAAVMAYFEKPDVPEISALALSCGIKLAQFYANEALRVLGLGAAADDEENADQLISWIRGKDHTIVGKRWLAQNAYPRNLRNKSVLDRSIEILLENKHLVTIKNGAEMSIDGKATFYREAFTVVPDDGDDGA
jgi:hypothetical protein